MIIVKSENPLLADAMYGGYYGGYEYIVAGNYSSGGSYTASAGSYTTLDDLAGYNPDDPGPNGGYYIAGYDGHPVYYIPGKGAYEPGTQGTGDAYHNGSGSVGTGGGGGGQQGFPHMGQSAPQPQPKPPQPGGGPPTGTNPLGSPLGTYYAATGADGGSSDTIFWIIGGLAIAGLVMFLIVRK